MKPEITLSGKLKEFADRRANILLEKKACVKAQQYERAAKVRDKEKQLEVEAIEFLKKDAQYELTDSKQMLQDIWMLFDLVEPGETTFQNALNRITVVNLQRINLVKKIEEYKSGKVTLDDIHNEIKKSFKAVREEVKEKIKDEILKIE
jgi:hypothetical protein